MGKCYTNMVGDEKPLPGTESISPTILETRSVVVRAGTFIGIRSGLRDILRGVDTIIRRTKDQKRIVMSSCFRLPAMRPAIYIGRYVIIPSVSTLFGEST